MLHILLIGAGCFILILYLYLSDYIIDLGSFIPLAVIFVMTNDVHKATLLLHIGNRGKEKMCLDGLGILRMTTASKQQHKNE